MKIYWTDCRSKIKKWNIDRKITFQHSLLTAAPRNRVPVVIKLAIIDNNIASATHAYLEYDNISWRIDHTQSDDVYVLQQEWEQKIQYISFDCTHFCSQISIIHNSSIYKFFNLIWWALYRWIHLCVILVIEHRPAIGHIDNSWKNIHSHSVSFYKLKSINKSRLNSLSQY